MSHTLYCLYCCFACLFIGKKRERETNISRHELNLHFFYFYNVVDPLRLPSIYIKSNWVRQASHLNIISLNMVEFKEARSAVCQLLTMTIAQTQYRTNLISSNLVFSVVLEASEPSIIWKIYVIFSHKKINSNGLKGISEENYKFLCS